MNESGEKTIWTIGHSTHTIEELLAMLHSFNIELVADIRNYPGSKRYPHFNKEVLEVELPKDGIAYQHFKNLGGRRKPNPHSANIAWRNEAFRGYADYMETNDFKTGIDELQKLATSKRTAYMCSEAVWWRCHRALVSDYLKFHGWNVIHIMNKHKSEEHSYTSAANFVDGKLTYKKPYDSGTLFNE